MNYAPFRDLGEGRRTILPTSNIETLSGNASIERLLSISNVRAFPNQFFIAIKDGTENSSELIKDFHFYATKINLGSYNLSVSRLASNQLTLIKKATIPDTIEIVLKEVHDWIVLRYFYRWYTENYYDPAKRVFKSGVKGKRKDFVINALKPEDNLGYHIAQQGGSSDIGLKITVKDALLVGPISLPSFSHEESKPFDFTFKIQSDDIQIEFLGSEN
jgi:hypothetical protein